MDQEAELLKALGKDGLEQAIDAKISSFHGLLTRDAALRLIAKERGLIREKECTLAKIPKGAREVSFSASVRKIWPVAVYPSGKRSRVVEVADNEGARPLVLWNGDVEKAGGLRTRDRITVHGAYERGGELHLGQGGALEISQKAAFAPLGSLEEGQEAHVRGVVTAAEGFAFTISDGSSERRCVMRQGLDRAAKIRPGDEVIVEDGRVTRGDIDISASRLLVKRKI
ncbi:MAG: hypothetical protein PHV13_03500 [Candidatus ainarchaeum sp.]|nr:hypothetical protein [Candidatus ainarchaeum sp.]